MNIHAHTDPATQINAPARPTNLDAGMAALADFARKSEQVDEALVALSRLTGNEVSRSVERLRQQLAEFEPCVTLLGQVKSGKTSLVNAMAGWSDLLPSDVNPWTSVVTSLHLTPNATRPQTVASFQFMTEGEWDRLLTKGGRIGELADRAGAEGELEKIREQIETMREKARQRLGRKFELLLGQKHEYGFFDKNLLERYICLGDEFDMGQGENTGDEQGRFADITRSADLYLNSPTLPFRMCLRDTPGVNDTFMMREQVTIQAVRGSRICVMVLSAQQALSSVDMGLIRLVSNLKSRDVLIFVNRIDELPDPVRQIPEIESSIRRTLKDHHGPVEAEIIFGSAYWAHKVLTGGMEDMTDISSAALLEWAEASLTASASDMSPPNMMWELSGLPALFRCLSERIVTDLGTPHLNKIASSAITIASGQQAADTIVIKSGERGPAMSVHDMRTEFDRLAQKHADALEAELDTLIEAYHQRADRAHANFAERATHSLISHLERNGENEVWEYSPTGLRMLLRSAYNVFGSRAQAMAKRQYEDTLNDAAEFYFRAFGSAVEGIQISVPAVPDIPSPVALGQTIALDFSDGWWTSWWRRTRGYKAFAKRFNKLINVETEDFMIQLKSVQTEDIRKAFHKVLAGFLEEQKDILLELATRASGPANPQELFDDKSEIERRDNLQRTMQVLGRYAG